MSDSEIVFALASMAAKHTSNNPAALLASALAIVCIGQARGDIELAMRQMQAYIDRMQQPDVIPILLETGASYVQFEQEKYGL